MKPDDIEFELSQLLDGELPAEQADALRQRLADDPALAEEYRLYKALDGTLSPAAEALEEVDWDFQRESIRGMLEREALLTAAGPSWHGRLMRWAATVTAAAAAIAVLVLAVQQFLPTAPETPVVPTPPGTQAGLVVIYVPPASALRAAPLRVSFREPTAADLAAGPGIVSGALTRSAMPSRTILISTGAGSGGDESNLFTMSAGL